jgi:Protein of unknown function (DUF2846)
MKLQSGIVKSVGAIAFFWMSACLAGPTLAPKADDQRAKTFVPAAGRAAIYVYRHSRGPAYKSFVPLAIDGQEIGGIAFKTYYVVEVEPGSHDVWLGLGPDLLPNAKLIPLVINAFAGQSYFVRSGTAYNQHHEVVDASTGKKELLSCCKLAVPAPAEASKLLN